MAKESVKKIMTGLLLLVTAIIFVSCSGTDNNPVRNNADNNPDTGPPADAAISISGFRFTPGSLSVKVGTTVVWTNKDSAPHTVTSDDDSFLSSGNLAQGDSFSITFESAGTYPYHCSIHPTMKGVIVVIR